MKVCVDKVSGEKPKNGEIQEYKDLDECVKTLLKTEDFHRFYKQVFVSLPSDKNSGIDYFVTIYDDWYE